jgi:hypothetical protein
LIVERLSAASGRSDMSTNNSGAGYGNHGGDETFDEGKKNQGVDPAREIPDDSGKGDYEGADEDKPES